MMSSLLQNDVEPASVDVTSTTSFFIIRHQIAVPEHGFLINIYFTSKCLQRYYTNVLDEKEDSANLQKV